jgi:cob(I)alamin adenosyltransferase
VPVTVTGDERMRPDGTFRFGVTDEDRREAQRGLACAKEILQGGTFDLIVLDEILSVVSGELLSPAELASLLAQVPERVELVLTGRCRDEGWLEPVDLISRVQKVRHYFDRGTRARRGIEY